MHVSALEKVENLCLSENHGNISHIFRRFLHTVLFIFIIISINSPNIVF